MLPIQAGQSGSRITRRSFLEAGTLGFLGLNLATRNQLAAAAKASRQDTSVILFWLSGGPGHMETWDPKPEAPQEYRGPFGAISTKIPGLQFGELLPAQAEIADQLSVIRTVNHGSGDHTKGNHWMLTGHEGPAFNAPDNRVQRRPAIGSVAARVRGPNQPHMPAYAGVPHLRGGTDNLFHYAAYLGGGSNPFIVNSDPNERKYRVRNLSLPRNLTLDRLEDRRGLLRSFDSAKWKSEAQIQDLDAHMQNALQLLTSRQVKQAFDIGQEPANIRDSYGRHTFGQSALLARRLVENGVTFVTVNCVPWDHHGSANRLQTEPGAKMLIPPLDQAIAGLVADLQQRGLYDKTLIVAMGEFGRTPRMNKYAGRDHWGRTFSVLMGGGGMNSGVIVGRSNARGETVVERPISPQDVAATIYHHLGIDPLKTHFYDRLDRPMPLLDNGQAIRELVG